MDYEKAFVPFVNEMADVARGIALKYFRQNLVIDEKEDKSPVTKGDREIESTLRALIKQRFPEHGIIGEEYGKKDEGVEFVWVIDPIDGTKAFATGKPLFGTIIGLVHNNRPVVGLIDQAFTKERWLGITDQFCLYNNELTKVAPPRSLSGARFYTAAPEMFHGDYFENFETIRKSSKWALYGCDCYAYGLLALGCVDLVMEQYLAPHDIMGLIPVIKGAGGHVTDWNGNEIGLDTDGKIIAASSKELAAEALSVINRGMPTPKQKPAVLSK
jgi:inositol-phosphate phosphatase/L-galactose 1-phosphate phosphatase/histidinol-phosphatase